MEFFIGVILLLLIMYMLNILLKRSANPKFDLGRLWLKKSPYFFIDANKKMTILYLSAILIGAIVSVFFLLSDLILRMLDFSN